MSRFVKIWIHLIYLSVYRCCIYSFLGLSSIFSVFLLIFGISANHEYNRKPFVVQSRLVPPEGNNRPLCKYDNAKGFYINAGQWIKCGHCNPDQQKAEKRPTASRKEMPVAEYLENPNLCPFCRSEEITTTGEIFYPDDFCGEYRQNVKCLACQRGWADCYTLSHFIPHAG